MQIYKQMLVNTQIIQMNNNKKASNLIDKWQMEMNVHFREKET